MKNLLLDLPPHLLSSILSFDEVSHKSRELWLCGNAFLQAKLGQSVRLVALRDRRELILCRLPRFLSCLTCLTHLEVDRSCFDIFCEQDAREIINSLNPRLEKLVFRVQNWMSILFPEEPTSDLESSNPTPSRSKEEGVSGFVTRSLVMRFGGLQSLSVGSKQNLKDSSSEWLTRLPSSLTELTSPISMYSYVAREYVEKLPRGLLRWEVEMEGRWTHQFNLLLHSALPPQLHTLRYVISRFSFVDSKLETSMRSDGLKIIPPSITRLEKAFSLPIDELIFLGREVDPTILKESHDRALKEVPFSVVLKGEVGFGGGDGGGGLLPVLGSSSLLLSYLDRPHLFTSLATHQYGNKHLRLNHPSNPPLNPTLLHPHHTSSTGSESLPWYLPIHLGKNHLESMILPFTSLTLLQASIDWADLDSHDCWPSSLRVLDLVSSGKRVEGEEEEEESRRTSSLSRATRPTPSGLQTRTSSLSRARPTPSSGLQTHPLSPSSTHAPTGELTSTLSPSSFPTYFFPPHLVALTLDEEQGLPFCIFNNLPSSLRSFKAKRNALINPLFCFYESCNHIDIGSLNVESHEVRLASSSHEARLASSSHEARLASSSQCSSYPLPSSSTFNRHHDTSILHRHHDTSIVSFPPHLTHLELDHFLLWENADSDENQGAGAATTCGTFSTNDDGDFFFLGSAPDESFFAPKLVRVAKCFPFERLPATLRTLCLKGSSIPFSRLGLLPPCLHLLQASFFKDADFDPSDPTLQERVRYLKEQARRDGVNLIETSSATTNLIETCSATTPANLIETSSETALLPSYPPPSSSPPSSTSPLHILQLLPLTLTDLHIEMSEDLDGWNSLPSLKRLHIVSYEPLDGSLLLQLPMHRMTHLHIEKIGHVTDEHIKALGRQLRYIHMNVDPWLTTPNAWRFWPDHAISEHRCPPMSKEKLHRREVERRRVIEKKGDLTFALPLFNDYLQWHRTHHED